MRNELNKGAVAPGAPEGARSATGGAPGAAAEGKRWSAGRKKEVVLRLLDNAAREHRPEWSDRECKLLAPTRVGRTTAPYAGNAGMRHSAHGPT